MRSHLYVTVAFALTLSPTAARAAEVCGNLADDSTANGIVDEGCWPAAVTGVCESPIACGRTGAVAPKTGQLVYQEPPDIDPRVPFGPPLAVGRVYMSLAADQSGYRGSLGAGWRHSFMAWLDWNTTPNPDDVIVRLVSGQEVLFTFDDEASTSTYDVYAPQPGYHLDTLRRHTTTSVWELITLDGWTYEYDDADCDGLRMLTRILDPFGKALTLTYDGECFLTEVADASGYRELRFAYDNNDKLDKVDFYLDDTLRVTVQYTVTSDKLEDVTVDAAGVSGSTLVRDYVWTGTKLDYIDDGDSKTLANFDYLAGAAGKVARISTGDGNLGYEYGNNDCDGGEGVYLYYNDTDATDAGCDAHSECENGNGFCGGETDPTAENTGVCYRVRRCVALSSSHDDLVDSVSSPGCTTCVDAKTYVWDTSPDLDLIRVESADQTWVHYERNADGLVTKMIEGDNDDNPSTVPADARVTYFYYDADVPGLVTEVRRLSELNPIGECDVDTTTDCKRTLYHYDPTSGNGKKLVGVQEIGFTYVWVSNDVESGGYDFTTAYTHDSNGRLTQINGPRPDSDTAHDIVDFTYWSDSDRLKDGMLKEVKRKLATLTYLTTMYDGYDYWGNPGSIQDPNGNFTCLTFHADLDVPTLKRVAMNNQSSCTTSHSSDLVTTTTYDSSKRVKKIEKPMGNCVHRAYDGKGRLEIVRERDDCTVASSGHNMELTYNDDGLVIKTEYKDASGAVTYRSETTYGHDRRLAEIINPTQTTKRKTFAYETDGMLDSITGEDGIGITRWDYDPRNRADFEQRFFASGSSDDYELLNCKQMDRIFDVTEEDSRSMERTWDDLGRNIQLVTPDSGTSRFVYDSAGNLKYHVEADGSADEMLHTFTYDPLNRLVTENTGDAACFSLGGAEIQYTYDTTSGCDGACENVSGRLSFVKTKISCDDDDTTDDTFDQFTYFKYDDAGRIVRETIEDDGGRSVTQNYTWDENGNQTMVEAPSGIDMKWTYGSGGSNSDGDRIATLVRNDGSDTTFISSAVWYPFGPIKDYQQGNTVSSTNIVAAFTWDLAYRPTELRWKYSTTDVFKVAYTFDAQGRVTARDFSAADSDVQDAWYMYDWQSRVVCDSTVAPSGTPLDCPDGTDRKNELTGSPAYSASSDRPQIYHRTLGYWPADTYTTTYVSGRDQINYITKSSDPTGTIDLSWDGRGNRLYDDDDEWADDRRDYTYDARNNLVTVSGKMWVSDSVVHDYTQVNAYDHRNRRFFKSLLDEDTDVEAHWFFYYNLQDRLIEVNYTPNIEPEEADNFQVIQFYWIGSRPVARVMTTYPAGTHGRRFVHADHLETPLDTWHWPSSGDATRAWAMNPDAFGWGRLVHGSTDYQPLRFPGQVEDEETASWFFDTGSSIFKPVRPPLSDNRYRIYDPLTASYLQTDPVIAQSRDSYGYAQQDPVSVSDPEGLRSIGVGVGGGGGDGGPLDSCRDCVRVPYPFCGVWCWPVDRGGFRGRCDTAPNPRPGQGHCFACAGDHMDPCDNPISIGGGWSGGVMAMTTSIPNPVTEAVVAAVQGPAKDRRAPSLPRVKCHTGLSIVSEESRKFFSSR